MKELRKYHAEDAELMFNFYYDMSRPKIEEYSKNIIWKMRYLKYPHTRGRKLGTKTKAMPDQIYLRVVNHFKKLKIMSLLLLMRLKELKAQGLVI